VTDVGIRLIHLLEQMTGGTREVAKVLGGYRKELVEQGFPEHEIAELIYRMEERLLGDLVDPKGERDGS